MEQQDLAVLNRQAIAAAKQHMGLVAWGTVALTAATLAGYVATLWLAITGGLPLWAGVALLGALTYMCTRRCTRPRTATSTATALA